MPNVNDPYILPPSEQTITVQRSYHEQLIRENGKLRDQIDETSRLYNETMQVCSRKDQYIEDLREELRLLKSQPQPG